MDTILNTDTDHDQIVFESENGFLDLLYEDHAADIKKRDRAVKNSDIENGNTVDKKRGGTKKHSGNVNPFQSNRTWSELMLCRPLLKALSDLGFECPTIVQSKIIPIALEGKDILVTAETGSGKTAAFLIPLLQRLFVSGVLKQFDSEKKHTIARGATKALILLPTRELAAQCFDVFQSLSKYLTANGILLTGGIPIKEQEAKLKQIPEVIIATPGRVLDILINSGCINMDGIEIVIMDEADRLLELGFIDECLNILKHCNKNRQTMLFSATLTNETKDLVHLSLVNPVYIKTSDSISLSKTLTFEMLMIPSDDLREACVLYLCKKYYKTHTIIFFQTKKSAHRMALIFQLLKFKSGELHGNLSQSKRFESIEKFKNGEIDYLLASELAARGLDIPGIKTVINAHIPTDTVRYIHRVGRTARMGSSGKAVTLYLEKERAQVRMILKKTSAITVSLDRHRKKLTSTLLEKYKSMISELEGEIKAILINEQLERDIRLCEATVKRASENDNEGRLWFRSAKEKKLSSKRELIAQKQRAYISTVDDTTIKPKDKVKKTRPPKKQAARGKRK